MKITIQWHIQPHIFHDGVAIPNYYYDFDLQFQNETEKEIFNLFAKLQKITPEDFKWKFLMDFIQNISFKNKIKTFLSFPVNDRKISFSVNLILNPQLNSFFIEPKIQTNKKPINEMFSFNSKVNEWPVNTFGPSDIDHFIFSFNGKYFYKGKEFSKDTIITTLKHHKAVRINNKKIILNETNDDFVFMNENN